MKKPLFSIIIPTKNRSSFMSGAVNSVLLQTFKDWELLVIDNDDTDETQEVMKQFSDPRIKVFRTGNLSMPDNWEYGLDEITGKYVLYIYDKMALHLDALERLKSCLEQHGNPQAVSWRIDNFDRDSGRFIANLTVDNKVIKVSSDDLIEKFLKLDMETFWYEFPFGYNSCVSKELLTSIKSGPMGRVCPPLCPDITMSLQILNSTDSIIHMSECLVTIVSRYLTSNGVSFIKRGQQGNEFISQLNFYG